MSTVVALSEFREVLDGSAGQKGDLRSPFGLSIPAAGAKDAPHLSPSIISEIRSGGGVGNAVRALRRMALGGCRTLFLDAGIGILPAIAAKLGAQRVLAFERDSQRIALAKTLFSANQLPVEAIHGHGAAVSVILSSASVEPGPSPAFDLQLILAEERIDTLIASLGATDPMLLCKLPATVTRVLIGGVVESDCSPARDLMISCLIGGGFSFDPRTSEGDAMCFRRTDQRESRRAG